MINLIPKYQTEQILSYEMLEEKKSELESYGIKLVRTSDFNFYLQKDSITIDGYMGHEYEEIALSLAEPIFAGPVTSILQEMFQLDFTMEHNEEKE